MDDFGVPMWAIWVTAILFGPVLVPVSVGVAVLVNGYFYHERGR